MSLTMSSREVVSAAAHVGVMLAFNGYGPKVVRAGSLASSVRQFVLFLAALKTLGVAMTTVVDCLQPLWKSFNSTQQSMLKILYCCYFMGKGGTLIGGDTGPTKNHFQWFVSLVLFSVAAAFRSYSKAVKTRRRVLR
eukprot:g3578.t1